MLKNMKIGLYNLETEIYNTAMMQVSQYHKEKGDTVEIYSPFYHQSYDKIYAFSIFNYSDKGYVSKDMIKGGTGFDIQSKLPQEIEECNYDYSIFPSCDHSFLWFSRGCFRNCPFCIVKEKEGQIHPVEPKNLNPNGKYIKVMDNNFFANPKWKEAIEKLGSINQKVDLQGFDIRIFNREQGEALQSLKHYRQFKFAWDNPRDNLDDKIELLLEYIKPRKLMCYILIGYWSTAQEDYDRVMHLYDNYSIESFAMPYNRFEQYQKDFTRWTNVKKIFKTRTWEEVQNEIGRQYI